MSNKTITDYTAAVTIDGSTDYLLIEQGGVYKKINRNTFTGLSSAPLGLTDTQSPQNKTYDNTNQVTLKGTKFTLQDDSDTTKQARFLMSSITTGNTRSYTLPDASATIVGTSATQTLTNKTLTSPTITGGTIDNSTITVDSISGHSSSTVVTVANLQISNGVLNSANAVTATSIAAGAIQPQALVSGTGSGWSWTSFTPSWTNLTVGNGTQSAKYTQIGKTVVVYLSFVVGTTSVVGTGPYFTPPVAPSTNYNTIQNMVVGYGQLATDTGNGFAAPTLSQTSNRINLLYLTSGATLTQVDATHPGTWIGGHGQFSITIIYEAA